MKTFGLWMGAACVMVLAPLLPAFARPMQTATAAAPAAQSLPPGEGKDALVKDCQGCHALNVITSQRKTESGWTDTVLEMRNRGANGSDDDMEKIIHYLAANFGPSGAAPASGSPAAAAPPAPASSGSGMALPPKKPQPTPQQVIDEHVAALNACDWNRMMAQYDDDVKFLSKDGNVVEGRAAIGAMFKNALQPPPVGQCGMKMTPEKTFVVGDTVNVIWRMDAPFFAEPYRGSEAFETKNGLLVLQVTTFDPSAIKMKK